MKAPDNSVAEVFLLAAATLAFLDENTDPASIRQAMQKALHSTQWPVNISFDQSVKKKAQRLIASFSTQIKTNHSPGFALQFPEGLSHQDRAICLLLANVFLARNCDNMPANSILDSLLILAEKPDIIKEWFWLTVYSRAFKLTLQALSSLRKETPCDGVDIRKLTDEVFTLNGCAGETLPGQIAVRLFGALIKEQEEIDFCLDRFLSSSHLPSSTPVERNFLRLALFMEASQIPEQNAIQKALAGSMPADMSARLKKFLRTGLVKAVNALSRSAAFQTFYAFSFNWPETDAALKRAFLFSSPSAAIYTEVLDNEPRGRAWQLVHGVWQNRERIDRIISGYSHKWRLERLGRIELLLLRMGIYEIEAGLAPPRVVISEILELCDKFGIPEAKSLVNGIMDAYVKGVQEKQPN